MAISTTVNSHIVVNFEDKFTDAACQAVETYKKCLDEMLQFQKQSPFLFLEDTIGELDSISRQLMELEQTKRRFEEESQLFLHLELVDKATHEAQKLRDELEKTFASDIVQNITIIQETIQRNTASRGNSKSDRKFELSPDSARSSGDFDGSSINPIGFDTFSSIKGFSSGIDRVPRDMIAMIHKDEAVLPKAQAEEHRLGKSSGMTIQRVEINMKLPDSFNPLNMGRQDFRQFTVKIKDELQRLDRRISN